MAIRLWGSQGQGRVGYTRLQAMLCLVVKWSLQKLFSQGPQATTGSIPSHLSKTLLAPSAHAHLSVKHTCTHTIGVFSAKCPVCLPVGATPWEAL